MTDSLVRYRVPLTMLHDALGPGWTWITGREEDEAVIDEIVVADTYHLRGLDLGPSGSHYTQRNAVGQILTEVDELPGATVLDLGAHIGIFAATCLRMGAARVIAVEPDSDNLALLRKNAPKTEVWACAVGDASGTLALLGDGAHAYTVPSAHGGGAAVEQITLADILGPLDRVAVLKVDVEGAEYATLMACPHDQLAKCDRIVLEWHGAPMCPWVGPAPIGQLVEYLAETHSPSLIGRPSEGGGMAYAHANDR